VCGTCRQEAEELWEALDSGNEQQALQLLRDSQHPKRLAFRKHPTSGVYAIHTAIDNGMNEIAMELSQSERYPGIHQQQDATGCVLNAPTYSAFLPIAHT
jgi:hypothetical protein